MIAVKFLISSLPYIAGEIAGFDQSIADRLVARGIAELVQTEAPQGAAPPAQDRAQRTYRKRA